MRRLRAVLGEARGSNQVQELARWLNPVAASPAAPRETVAALDAFGPSLMPRTARLHGVAMGLGVLGARATTGVVEKLTRLAVPADARLPAQLVARAVIGGAGAALAAVPERRCHRLWVASLRSTGQLLRDGAAGAAVHDLGRWVQRRYPSQMGVPAWKSLPTWFLIADGDQAIPPDAQRQFAPRMGATTVEVSTNHVAMVSHPDEVLQLIKTAAEAVPAAT
jgi:hypothetical protein